MTGDTHLINQEEKDLHLGAEKTTLKYLSLSVSVLPEEYHHMNSCLWVKVFTKRIHFTLSFLVLVRYATKGFPEHPTASFLDRHKAVGSFSHFALSTAFSGVRGLCGIGLTLSSQGPGGLLFQKNLKHHQEITFAHQLYNGIMQLASEYFLASPEMSWGKWVWEISVISAKCCCTSWSMILWKDCDTFCIDLPELGLSDIIHLPVIHLFTWRPDNTYRPKLLFQIHSKKN